MVIVLRLYIVYVLTCLAIKSIRRKKKEKKAKRSWIWFWLVLCQILDQIGPMSHMGPDLEKWLVQYLRLDQIGPMSHMGPGPISDIGPGPMWHIGLAYYWQVRGPNRLFLGLGKGSNTFYNNPRPKNDLVGAKKHLWALKSRLFYKNPIKSNILNLEASLEWSLLLAKRI